MKKLLLVLLLAIATLQMHAYSYPATVQQLLSQFQSEKQQVEIITTPDNKYKGYVILCRNDYIVFKTISEDVMIIPISVIREITLL